MVPIAPSAHRYVTLVLCTVLHAFTHAFGSALVPLYLLIVADLKLGGVRDASFIVSVYGLVYCLMSFFAGIVADRLDRKKLLGLGLIGNAIAIGAMGLTHDYWIIVALAALAGICGSLFHPSANALVTEHFPKSPGMAIGLLGIGAGLGFFVGPQFAGWRADAATWQIASIGVASWQRPCVEMGIAGVVCGTAFLIFAREARGHHPKLSAVSISGATSPGGPKLAPSDLDVPHPPLSWPMRRRVAAVAVTLGMRDYAGTASFSLASIYLQRARGLGVKETGFILGAMVLVSVIINPLSVWLTPGRRRLPILSIALVIGGIVIASTPAWPTALVLPALCAFQAVHLGSYAMSDAAILERVDARHRGRVVGLFLTIAGTFASTSPWLMGVWTDALGDRAHDPRGYYGPFGMLGVLIALASLATPLIARLGRTKVASGDSSLSGAAA